MKQKLKKKFKTLSDWDWETLVASWRYYENRETIASSMFPANIVRRFFSGDYAKCECDRIAHQFWSIDHGIRGLEDWTAEWRRLPKCDAEPWCKFWSFCQAWELGFNKLVLDDGKGDAREVEAFTCGLTGRWYPKDRYILNPVIEVYCDSKSIRSIDGVEVKP